MLVAMPRLLYVVNIPRFFVSHRLPLALAAKDAGYEVHVATSDADTASIEKIHAAGLPFHPLPLSQHSTSVITEIKTLFALIRLYRTLKPDIVHHVSIKPVMYGGIAAHLTGIPAVVSAMSGLGYVFIGDSPKQKILRQIVKPALKLALAGKKTRMIFQNPDDQQRFIEMSVIQADKTVLIRGSGVDTTLFYPQPEAPGLPVILFAGRLMWQKGIGEFMQAAKQLKGQARFVIAGYAEPTSPSAVSEAQLQAWQQAGLVELLGNRSDMPEVFAMAHIVCLPSTYGEGVPKVLIEAAACARPIVTTDTPGCREIVRHDENGMLIPPGNTAALITALQTLIHDAALRQRLGARGRDIVEHNFSLERVVQATFAVYDTLLKT
jgi:glycosyltransferase involved in cell wall biosynthesis